MSLLSWLKDLYFTYSLVTNVYMLNAWEAAVFSKRLMLLFPFAQSTGR